MSYHLITHMSDLADRAVQTGSARSKFLTQAERAMVEAAFQHTSEFALSFDGGFAEAERTVAVFRNADWGQVDRAGNLVGLSIVHSAVSVPKPLCHRDILGAVLGLGLERNVIGDILVGDGESFLVCLAEIAVFLTENLQKAGKIPLNVRKIPLESLPTAAPNLEERSDTVAALRLDAVTAAMFRLSRGDAAEAIRRGNVQLAHLPCENVSKPVAVGDVVSVRGLGRVKLLEVGGVSKKGRIWVRFGMYS